MRADDEAPDFAALFAADLESERVDLRCGGEAGFVELRPMDADTYARYVAGHQRMRVDPDAPPGERVQVETDLAAQELELLLGTVTEFRLARRRRTTSGETTLEETRMHPGAAALSREQLAEVYRGMTREFRAWLVAECRRVNGLSADPLPPSAAGGVTP